METLDPKKVAAEAEAMDQDDDAPGQPDPSFPEMTPASSSSVKFQPLKPGDMTDGSFEVRKVAIPQHRLTPLKQHWLEICNPVVQHMKLQIRMNTRTRNVELRTCADTEDVGALAKAAEFVRAFVLGFDVNDALALLRLDDLCAILPFPRPLSLCPDESELFELDIDTFSVDDVKTLHGDHLSRAIGRVAGKDGKTKFTIENSTRTRIVLADKKVHLMGSFHNIKVARDAVVDLILGAPPGKVYAKLRTIGARLKERF